MSQQKCHVCNEEFNNYKELSYHIKSKHKMSSKEYYDMFLKKEDEGFCLTCGKETEFAKISIGYRKYCCYECMNKNEAKIKKQKQTTFEHYGVYSPAQSAQVLEKYKNTCISKYGVDNPSKNEEVKQKKTETFYSHYGVSSFTKTEEYREKTKATCLERYGCESSNQCEEIKKKQKDSLVEHYGNEPWKSSEIINKRKETCLKKYGCEYVIQNDEIKEKIKQICLEKYGCENPMQNKEIRKKTKHKFWINGKCYDSSWEYKYEQYLIQNNIKYEYEPDMGFYYYFKNKKHKYYPDFAIYDDEGKLVEIIDIKGDHLFKQMQQENTKEHQKYICILKNNVKLLLKNDLKQLGIL